MLALNQATRQTDHVSPRLPELLPDFLTWQRVPVYVGTGDTRALVACPHSINECQEIMAFCRKHGLSICPRGSGRSYGDAILNDQNVILDMSKINRVIEVDGENGTVTVEPGVRLVDVYQQVHHLGWTIPASPTDSTISVGGALAANVNGKDSWRVGNFGDQIIQLKVVTAAGQLITIDRQNNKPFFLAVIGGMGLLALVVEVKIRLMKIPSPYLEVEITPAENVDDLLEKLYLIKEQNDFLVVWIDTYAKGHKLGRSVIHATRWSEQSEDPETVRADIKKSVASLATQRSRAMMFYKVFRPFINFGFHLQQIPIRLFNSFYFYINNRDKPASGKAVREMFLKHNFDKSYTVPPPDILCGPHGYTVQITVPRSVAREAMTEMLQLCQSIPCPPATTILRLHRRDDHVISFSDDGFSLNVEFHPKKRHARKMAAFMENLIECGIKYGSRVHLPKDMILSADQFRRLYPRHQEFIDLKQVWDPDSLFQSDMYRRLFVTD